MNEENAMRFDFEGNTYRISFRHEKSWRWEDHARHKVEFTLRPKANTAGLGCGGTAVLFCATCNVQLSHLSKDQRQRRTFCTILGVAANGEIFHGMGRPNQKAGDQFTREGGRKAALANVLQQVSARTLGFAGNTNAGGKEFIAAFRSAAWKAYLGRTKTAVSGHA